ncbi:lytic transglycosylase domain-containing protein [Gorillibacterium sp. sgz5001074]|uniref:lytic transglycosylase domain-containing protein n=1 Tax=Gorillibacterium sp. sgz5001074 TaxID=3446695 RepID=UPI003F67E6FA
MRKPRKKRWFALILMMLVLILFYRSDWLGRLMYPIRYKQEIATASANVGIDPYLVAAVIRVESNYKPELASHKGAVGLMQVMPDTAQWIFEREGFRGYKLEDLTVPQVNIQVGTAYLAFLLQQFGRDQVKAVASYNAGQGNVNKWLYNEIWDGRLESIDQIPFWETRKYVTKVMYYYKKYQDLYGS